MNPNYAFALTNRASPNHLKCKFHDKKSMATTLTIFYEGKELYMYVETYDESGHK